MTTCTTSAAKPATEPWHDGLELVRRFHPQQRAELRAAAAGWFSGSRIDGLPLSVSSSIHANDRQLSSGIGLDNDDFLLQLRVSAIHSRR